MGNTHNSNNNSRRSVGSMINRVFESAGPDGKVRGTPQQIIDKYQALARDAQLAGDRVAAESFLQHSEHYSRLLGEAQQHQNETRQPGDRDETRDGSRGEDAPRHEGYPDQSEQQRDQRAAPRGEQRDARADQPREQRDQPRDRTDPRPAPQPAIASSLTTIDPAEDDEFGGLIETPESGAAPPAVKSPAPAATPSANGASHAAGEAAAPEEAVKPKRGRPRRKARTEDGETTAGAAVE